MNICGFGILTGEPLTPDRTETTERQTAVFEIYLPKRVQWERIEEG